MNRIHLIVNLSWHSWLVLEKVIAYERHNCFHELSSSRVIKLKSSRTAQWSFMKYFCLMLNNPKDSYLSFIPYLHSSHLCSFILHKSYSELQCDQTVNVLFILCTMVFFIVRYMGSRRDRNGEQRLEEKGFHSKTHWSVTSFGLIGGTFPHYIST